MGYGRFNRVDCPPLNLPVSFVQASGKDMVLPTTQLLWVAPVSTLMLLLIALASLLVISTMVSMGILKIGI